MRRRYQIHEPFNLRKTFTSTTYILEPNDRYRRLYLSTDKEGRKCRKKRKVHRQIVVCVCQPSLNTVILFPFQISMIFFPVRNLKKKPRRKDFPSFDGQDSVQLISGLAHHRFGLTPISQPICPVSRQVRQCLFLHLSFEINHFCFHPNCEHLLVNFIHQPSGLCVLSLKLIP